MVSALMKSDADYLLIAKPVANNHLGIRRDCAVVFIDFGRLLVVLSKGRHLGRLRPGEACSNCVRSGNKVFWPLVPWTLRVLSRKAFLASG